MDEKLSLSHTIALLLAGGIIFVVSLVCNLPYPETVRPLWRGYYTLLIQGEPVDKEIFTRAGITGVVSEDTQAVEFSDFITSSTVALKELETRFEPSDPRLDPYMKAVSGYFKGSLDGESCSVYFIPDSNNPDVFVSALKKNLDPAVKVVVVGEEKRNSIPYLVFFLLYIVGVLLWKGDNYLFIILSALPWWPFIFAGTLLPFTFAVVAHLVFINLYDELSVFIDQLYYYSWKGEGRRNIVVFSFYSVVVFLAGLVILGITVDPLWGAGNFFLLFLGKIGAVLLIKVSAVLINRRRYHRLFIPIGVSQEKKIIIKSSNRLLFIPIIAVILVFPLTGIFFSPPDYIAEIPVPITAEGVSRFIYTDLRILWDQNGTEPEKKLPDIADYITHKAYQESYFYGGEYGFPEESGVAISAFLPDSNGSGKVSMFSKKVADFGASWFESLMPENPVDLVAALLLDQDRPVGVEYRTLSGRSENPALYLIHVLFCCIMLAPLAFWNFYLTSRVLHGMTNSR